jgi:uncharacterized repeat protein (TIGR03833 family)
MDGRERKDVRPGLTVDIVLKQDERTGRLTRGVVKDVESNSVKLHQCAAGPAGRFSSRKRVSNSYKCLVVFSP